MEFKEMTGIMHSFVRFSLLFIFFIFISNFSFALSADTSVQFNVESDMAAPQFTSIYPSGEQFNQTNTVKAAMCTDEAASVNATFSWNGLLHHANLTYNGTQHCYEYNFTNTSFPGSYTINITAKDLSDNTNKAISNFSVIDITKPFIRIIEPSQSTYENGSQIILKANATDHYYDNIKEMNVNVTWNNTHEYIHLVYVNGTWQGAFNRTQSPDNYTSLFIAVDNAGNINITQTSFEVITSDTPKVLNSTITPPINTIGEPVNLTLNATNTAQILVAYPNGTAVRINVTSGISYTFTNTTQIGTYNVTFISNNTFGKSDILEDTFIIAKKINWTINVRDTVSNGLNATLTVSYKNYTIILDTRNETFTLEIPNSSVDVLIEPHGVQASVKMYGVVPPPNDNLTLIMDVDENLSGYLRVFNIKPEHNFTTTLVTISYNGTVYNDEDNLKVFKCSNWSGTACMTTFNEIAASQSKADDEFAFYQTDFSAFGIKEVTPPVQTGGSTGTGGPARESFEITVPYEVSEEIVKGTTKRIPIYILNRGSKGVTLAVEIDGLEALSAKEIIYVGPNERRTYYLEISGDEIGSLKGKVIFSADKKYVTSVYVDVIDGFLLKILDINRFWETGSSFNVTYEIYYRYISKEGEILYMVDGQKTTENHCAESIMLGTNEYTKAYTKELEVPVNLNAGLYTFTIEANDGKRIARDSAQIQIYTRKPILMSRMPQYQHVRFDYLILIALLLVLTALLLTWRREINRWFDRTVLVTVRRKVYKKKCILRRIGRS